jgi:hypothetical protein
MAWQTPKTDWDVDYVPSATDLNRIEENIEHLSGNSDTVASANSLNIGDSNFVIITGNTHIYNISTLGRNAGSRLILQSDGVAAVLLGHIHGSTPANYADLYINVAGTPGDDYLGDSGDIGICEFVFNGTYWVLISNSSR